MLRCRGHIILVLRRVKRTEDARRDLGWGRRSLLSCPRVIGGVFCGIGELLRIEACEVLTCSGRHLCYVSTDERGGKVGGAVVEVAGSGSCCRYSSICRWSEMPSIGLALLRILRPTCHLPRSHMRNPLRLSYTHCHTVNNVSDCTT